MKLIVISCSLNPGSRSRQLAELAVNELKGLGAEVDFLDLQSMPLPICDGSSAYGDANARAVTARIEEATGVLVATPVYNYDVNAAAKNLLELSGDAWTGKVVGFLCAAGGNSSYMSVMSFANSLMLDYRCLVVPRFVYFSGKTIDPEIQKRIAELSSELLRIVTGLAKAV
jgi:FMN reductase